MARTSKKKMQEPIRLGTGKTGVLLLHGFTGTPYVFREISQTLADLGYSVSAPLIAGHGTTEEDMKAKTWHDWYLSVQDAYLELQKDTEEIFVIGGSFGCNLACMLASKHPVSGLVLIGYPRWIHNERAIKLGLPFVMAAGVEYYPKPRKYFEEDSVFSTTLGGYEKIPLKSLREFFRLISRVSNTVLPAVTCPTLIIQSENDGLVLKQSGPHVFKLLGTKKKELKWVNEAHHRLHLGESRVEIFEYIRVFMVKYTQLP